MLKSLLDIIVSVFLSILELNTKHDYLTVLKIHSDHFFKGLQRLKTTLVSTHMSWLGPPNTQVINIQKQPPPHHLFYWNDY